MAIKLGIMGFGNIGRKIYSETLNMDNIEVSAICDIGDPEILKYLLKTEFDNMDGVELDGNYLVNEKSRSRFLSAINPGDVAFTSPNERHALVGVTNCTCLVFTRGPRGGKNYESDTIRLKKPIA